MTDKKSYGPLFVLVGILVKFPSAPLAMFAVRIVTKPVPIVVAAVATLVLVNQPERMADLMVERAPIPTRRADGQRLRAAGHATIEVPPDSPVPPSVTRI